MVQEDSRIQIIIEIHIELEAVLLHYLQVLRFAALGILVCTLLLFPAAYEDIFLRHILLQHLGHLPDPPLCLCRVYECRGSIFLQVHPFPFVEVYGCRVVGQVCIVDAVAGHILAAGQLAELLDVLCQPVCKHLGTL